MTTSATCRCSRTDAYGNFIRGRRASADRHPAIGADGIEGNTADDRRRSDRARVRAGIGVPRRHGAPTPRRSSPTSRTRVPTGTRRRRHRNRPGQPATSRLIYDNELLDAHFVAGDGRVNENIGLTAVQHLFHSEHDRLVAHIKDRSC